MYVVEFSCKLLLGSASSLVVLCSVLKAILDFCLAFKSPKANRKYLLNISKYLLFALARSIRILGIVFYRYDHNSLGVYVLSVCLSGWKPRAKRSTFGGVDTALIGVDTFLLGVGTFRIGVDTFLIGVVHFCDYSPTVH